MVYQFTKDLETGDALIDREHQELLRAVNHLMEECGKGKGRAALEPTLRFLLDYVNKHFAHEEELQKKSSYPNLASHRLFHEKYKRKLVEIAEKIPAAGPSVSDLSSLNTHIGVLIAHIRSEDKKLGAFLHSK